jgi:hypothetical protein
MNNNQNQKMKLPLDLLNSEGGILVLKKAGRKCNIFCVYDEETSKIHVSDLLLRLKNLKPVFEGLSSPPYSANYMYSDFSKGERLSAGVLENLIKNLEKILLIEILEESATWETQITKEESRKLSYIKAKETAINRIFQKYKDALS